MLLEVSLLTALNYDGSYRIAQGNEANFKLGDTVSITLSDGSTSGGTAQIIDKWSFINPTGAYEVRMRFKCNTASTEQAINTDQSLGKFTVTKGSDSLVFISPEYSNDPY